MIRSSIFLPGLAGKAALVTGGSRGIGRATVQLLGAAGARVGIAFRSDEEAAAGAAQLALSAGAKSAWSFAADLSDPGQVEALFGESDRQFGGELDLFVGNAGIWNEKPRPIVDLPPEEWAEMMAVNLTSVYLTTREAARRLGDGGRIVLVTSTAAQRGEAEHSHYAASKGAIQSFVKSLAVELGPAGITVNAVAPGWVDTDMSANVLRGGTRTVVEGEIPVRRIATPLDVAGPIVFLASSLARHVNGEVLNVNGGSVLCG
ncbi:MAG: SDR family NAD(P)-dependent oxidoreductase [Gemmatimonadota bacterium]|jgi:3-oxoacyl-[acyl-carrier protein] reductase